jgi:hypothetical protein
VRNPRSLAIGVSVGIAAAAMVVFQPSATTAGASPPSARQSGSAGSTAAQVGSRVLLDSLDPGPSAGGRAVPGVDAGDLTIAVASLHASTPVHHPPTHGPTAPPVPVPQAPASVPEAAVPAPVPSTSPPSSPPAPAAPVAPVAPGPAAPSPSLWAELRECESGDNYTIDTGNGYYGAYQFSPTTWQGLGYSGLPNQAAPAVQDQAAAQLQAEQGWAPWPGCSAKLGL